MISISGSGTISQEFEVSTSKTGNPYVRLNLWVKTSKKNTDGKCVLEFITLFVCRTRLVEHLIKYCQKGSMIEFTGKFEPNKFKNKEGFEVSGYTIMVNELAKLTLKEDVIESVKIKENATEQKIDVGYYQKLREEYKDATPF